jgi:hypothetical protein
MKPSALSDLKVVLDRLVGNANIISNNVLFIDFTGSHEKAQLLTQMWYWAGKTKDRQGWFYKTYKEWHEETRIPEHSVRRFVKAFCDQGFLFVKFAKVGKAPVLHYRLDKDILIGLLVTFCQADTVRPLHGASLDPDNLQPSQEANNLQASIYRDTENTNRESTPAQISDLNTYPSRNTNETATDPTAYLSAIELFKREAAAVKLTYPAAFLEPYFLHKQQKGDFYGISAPVGETDTRRWLSKHYAGLQAWAKRQPQFDRPGPQGAQEKPASLSFSIKK